jgi:RNA polymerase sigma factor (sigma-70 family)
MGTPMIARGGPLPARPHAGGPFRRLFDGPTPALARFWEHAEQAAPRRQLIGMTAARAQLPFALNLPRDQEHPAVSRPCDEPPADLSARAAAGDRAAFEALHRRFAGGLSRLFLARTGGRVEPAEDLSQRTWMACWRSLQAGRYDPSRAAFSTFLYAIGTNIWREHLRRHGRAPDIESHEDLSFIVGGDDPSAAQRLAELLEDLRACLRGEGESLSPEDRWILRAVSSGASDREMARDLGVAPSTMNARKRAALDRLRRWLAVRGHRAEPSERPGAQGQ